MRNEKPAGPGIPGCGILLLFSIVLETHSHYASLSTRGAYLILFIAGAAVFVLSIRYRASMLICLGVPGSAAAAMAIDFPNPLYPVMSLFLLSAIVAASYAFKQTDVQISALVYPNAGGPFLAAVDCQNERPARPAPNRWRLRCILTGFFPCCLHSGGCT
jgi:hypothetical protein